MLAAQWVSCFVSSSLEYVKGLVFLSVCLTHTLHPNPSLNLKVIFLGEVVAKRITVDKMSHFL